MADPLQKIDETLETLEKDLEEYSGLAESAAREEAKFKLLRARKMLEARDQDGLKTISDKEAWVDDQLEFERIDFLVAQARLDAMKQRLNVLRSVLNGYQTLVSASRHINDSFVSKSQ